MDPTTEAALPGGAPTDIVQVPPPTGEAISTRDAARSLASFRLKQRAGASALASPQDDHRPAPDAAAAPPADQTADAAAMPDPSAQAQAEADAAPPGSDPGAPGETTASAEPPAAQAPIEPPRSWTKEARERFASLSKAAQPT
jgi:hypothetical protein